MGVPRPFPWLAGAGRVPLLVKVVFTAYLVVLVPAYWQAYGPTNFLYFCDMSLFLTLVAVWAEWSLPVSMAAVGIMIPQTLWVIDFLLTLCGLPSLGMTAYMFSDQSPVFLRGLSLFHGWLPFLLLYLVWRQGYDRRGLAAWTLLAWTLMLISYLWLPAPPPPADNPNLPVNIDYVYGPRDDGPQTWMPPLAWLAFVYVSFPVVFWIPMHFLLRRLAPPAAR
jgi:hypothetical protein